MTREEMKAQAKALRTTPEGASLSHGQALDALARRHGYRDWNVACAALEATPTGYTPAEGVRRIKALKARWDEINPKRTEVQQSYQDDKGVWWTGQRSVLKPAREVELWYAEADRFIGELVDRADVMLQVALIRLAVMTSGPYALPFTVSRGKMPNFGALSGRLATLAREMFPMDADQDPIGKLLDHAVSLYFPKENR